MQASRHIVFLPLAGLVTFGLFWIMQALIGVEGEALEEPPSTVIDFVRLKPEEEVEEKKRELPDKTPPEDEPPPPDMHLAQNLRPQLSGDGSGTGFDAEMEVDTGSGLGLGAADQDVVPLVRVQPVYPVRAAQRGIEGWVELEFTISRSGTVKDARVINYYPSTVFNSAAMRAIRRWKYNPKTVNGKAVERPGVNVRLVFQLNK